MTESEERFERIEKSLAATAESQAKTNVMIADLVKSVAAYVESAAAATKSLAAGQHALSQSVADYVASSKARMERTEASLDNLIRLIASEHENGKKS
jgi:hypothetical protein